MSSSPEAADLAAPKGDRGLASRFGGAQGQPWPRRRRGVVGSGAARGGTTRLTKGRGRRPSRPPRPSRRVWGAGVGVDGC